MSASPERPDGNAGEDRRIRELEDALASERQRARDLQQECLRLNGEVGRMRGTLDEVRRALRLIFRSWSWRLGAGATAIAARALRRGHGPSGQAYLEGLLGLARDDEQLAERFGALPRHAHDATTADWLVRRETALLGPDRAPPSRPLRLRLEDCDRTLDPDYFEIVDGSDADLFLIGVGKASTAAALRDRLAAASAVGSPTVLLVEGPVPTSLVELLASHARVALREPQREFPDATVLGDDRALTRLLCSAIAVDPSWTPPLHEPAYLAQNPDALAAVRTGRVANATEHWETRGRDEFIARWRDYRPYAGPVTLGLREDDGALRAACAEEVDGWDAAPLISVLMPVYRVAVEWLEKAIGSVLDQLYPHWELVIVDDASGDRAIDACLDRAAADERIRVLRLPANVGIAAASDAGLAEAQGDFVAFLDHDDELALDALWLVARVVVEHDPDLLYSDEAKLAADGRVVEPHFKPGFSPELIRAQNYISHLGVYRRTLLAAIGGFRPGFEGAQDHDLLLRALGRARSVFHLPRVLYYWRKVPGSTAARFGAKSHAWDAGVAAVADELATHGLPATAEKDRFPGTTRVRFAVAGDPLISIIVPFRDQPALLEQCLTSLLRHTDYQAFEVIGVDNQSQEAETRAVMDRFANDDRVRFTTFDAPFNFAAINNRAADLARGEHLLLLNNDIEVTDAGWLTELVSHSQRPGIGAVGGRLRYPDGTVQHAGVVLGIGGVAGHSHKYFPASHGGYFCRPHLVQNVAAVTGACLMVERRLFEAAGGLEEQHLSVAFNDIDFCLRLLELGYRNIYTPHAELVHHESKSRGPEDTLDKRERFAAERRWMQQRHRRRLTLGDPWYNPNLTLDRENFAVREAWNP